jgi:hypothetical protein
MIDLNFILKVYQLKIDGEEVESPKRVRAIKHIENSDSLKDSLNSRSKLKENKHQLSYENENEIKHNSCCRKEYKCVIF